MKSGKVYVVRDGLAVTLTQQMTFPNNLIVNPDGSCRHLPQWCLNAVDGRTDVSLDGETSISTKDTVTLIKGRVVVQKDGQLITLAICEPHGHE